MKPTNQFWNPIQRTLWWSKAKSVFVLFLVSVAFPLVEGIFINLWTSASDETANAFLVGLVTIISLHSVIAIMVLIDEARSQAESILPRAFQLEEDSEKLSRELQRRKTTNKLVREAFEHLNVQSCEFEYAPSADTWCLKGFSRGLLPVLTPFLQETDVALGVNGSRFSLEVYFKRDTVPIHGCKNDCHRGLSQLACYSTHIGNCVAVNLSTKCSPAQIGFDAGMAFEQHIDDSRHLFYSNGKPVESVYFRRFATCPINENCGDFAEGVLVLTSMQDEPFAEDVLETLAFLATIISTYLSAYRRCYEQHNSSLKTSVKAAAATVDER